MAEQIKSFLDTAVNKTYRSSLYHRALYDWHILDIKHSPNPGQPPYFSDDFFAAIRLVKNEGLLNLSTMSLSTWYKVLLENHITTEVDDAGFRFEKRCKIETNFPDVDWKRTWSLARIKGLESFDYSFVWKMIHNLLPTQQRLHKILPSIHSPECTLCNSKNICDLVHVMFECSYNHGVGLWLLKLLDCHVPPHTPQQVILLDINPDDNLRLPIVWLIANTLGNIWTCRTDKKNISLFDTRAKLEANIMLLRKTRFEEAAETLHLIINQ